MLPPMAPNAVLVDAELLRERLTVGTTSTQKLDAPLIGVATNLTRWRGREPMAVRVLFQLGARSPIPGAMSETHD